MKVSASNAEIPDVLAMVGKMSPSLKPLTDGIAANLTGITIETKAADGTPGAIVITDHLAPNKSATIEITLTP